MLRVCVCTAHRAYALHSYRGHRAYLVIIIIIIIIITIIIIIIIDYVFIFDLFIPTADIARTACNARTMHACVRTREHACARACMRACACVPSWFRILPLGRAR